MKLATRLPRLEGRQVETLHYRVSYTSTHRLSSQRSLSTICAAHPLPQRRRLSRTPSIRPGYLALYHSQDRDQPPPFLTEASAILSSALPHVSTHGFTNTALSNGARDAGYPEVSVNLFPRGAFDLIFYHLVTQRLALRNSVQFPEMQGKQLGMGSKVRSLVLHRLQANQFAIRHWQQALAIMAQPSYVPTALHELFLLSDEIWHLAGDTAVDSSWYTKRATLSAIFSSTEVFMTTDTSPGFADTERFLDRRLQEVQSAGQTLGAVSEWVGFSGWALMNVLRSKGVRM